MADDAAREAASADPGSSDAECEAGGPDGGRGWTRPPVGLLERPEDMARVLDACMASIEELRRKQEQMVQRQEAADSVRRGQLDCMSERIFEAEKNLRQAEERQHDAIEKASATFQKHASDVEQERQNLMCVIGQVNQNFEHVSSEIARHGFTIGSLEQNIAQIQGSITQANMDLRGSLISLGHDVAVLDQALQDHQQSGELQHLQHTIQSHQEQMKDMQANIQVMHDAVMRFTQVEVRQRDFADRLAEIENVICEPQGWPPALPCRTVAPRGRGLPAVAGAGQGEWMSLANTAASPRQRSAPMPPDSQPPMTLMEVAQSMPSTQRLHADHWTGAPLLHGSGRLNDREELGPAASPGCSSREALESLQHGDGPLVRMEVPTRHEEQLFQRRAAAAWQDLAHQDRLEPPHTDEMGVYGHPGCHFDPFEDVMQRQLFVPARNIERGPEASAVPSPGVGLGGTHIGV
mmetsp:Transcript_32758/g.101550  ORF Transcript_32758/g.101550 Transcript_32758/m.101550 type:complete len:464 (-) Transcript_32758:90-1481(-)|eukprot:CAMPEP_0204522150 /NCGR_PEP_ID=MMETSP0661-20131031/6164_1 /ASSEMBLY_ACC=CAM_ASM_000606 /TAXON_ID=109239 /ORGANISM="Alexandrium margalefi, Strain AMGDE01CS-322" /LENGTH=463 /DNA_ID=CAMNT_0051527791 /DNA_START=36 /DNA_END=1427 /DNA_ORIENTATION=-